MTVNGKKITNFSMAFEDATRNEEKENKAAKDLHDFDQGKVRPYGLEELLEAKRLEGIIEERRLWVEKNILEVIKLTRGPMTNREANLMANKLSMEFKRSTIRREMKGTTIYIPEYICTCYNCNCNPCHHRPGQSCPSR